MAKIEGITYPGMTGEIQCQDPTRYSVGNFQRRANVERFELRYGDRGVSGDEPNRRERIEFRDRTLVEVSPNAGWFRQSWGIYINQEEYPEMTPKQTHGQLFDEVNGYPILFMRRELGVQQIFVNSKFLGPQQGYEVPSLLNEWNDYELEVLPRPGVNAASFILRHNGKVAFELRNISLIEASAKSLYWKHGIYRSSMDQWDAAHPGIPAPTQVVYYSNVSRTPLNAPVVPSAPPPVLPPIVTPPVPVPPPVVPTMPSVPVVNHDAVAEIVVAYEAAATAINKAVSKSKRLFPEEAAQAKLLVEQLRDVRRNIQARDKNK